MTPLKIKTALWLFAAAQLITLMTTPSAIARAAGPAYRVKSHDLHVTVDLKRREVRGIDNITLNPWPSGQRVLGLYLRRGSVIDHVEYEGEGVYFSVKPGDTGPDMITIKLPGTKNPGTLSIKFHGTFGSIEKAREKVRRGVAYVDDGVMGPEGAYLPASSFWYPREAAEMAFFNASFSVPLRFVAMTEGEWVGRIGTGHRTIDSWTTPTRLDGLDLIASRFVVEKETHRGIDIYTFFFKKDQALSSLYIRKTKGYIDMYEEMLGPYPFKKFAVVEGFLPTGYGMPGFTLLGSSVLRLPFIPDISLGHEIAHSWFGNSVFVDDSLGNWSEALTTYVADYHYARKSGKVKARDFRLDKLRGYKNFAGKSRMALKDFVDATTTASRAVGYNKGLLVFNMLNNALGDDAFGAGLKRFYVEMAFKRASWADLQEAFEKASGKDLDWFFAQWVYRGGGPELALEDPERAERKGRFFLEFKILQKEPAYAMSLPILIKTEGNGAVLKQVAVSGTAARVSIETDAMPLSFEIDPGYENFRILSDPEVPPSFSVFFGDESGVIIVPDKRPGRKYSRAATLLSKDFGQRVVTHEDADVEEYLNERSVFIFGGPGENPAFDLVRSALSEHVTITEGSFEIAGKTYDRRTTALAVAVKNPKNPAKNICVFLAKTDGESILKTAKRLRYFLPKSYVVFSGSVSPAKGLFPGERVLGHEFKDPAGDDAGSSG